MRPISEVTDRLRKLVESQALEEDEMEDFRADLDSMDDFIGELVKRVSKLEKQLGKMKDQLEFHGLM